jgi:general secretion pathway protein H
MSAASPRAVRAFTLIELLVVVVIIGVLALALTIAVGSADGERRLAHEAESFAARLGYACNRAELTGREIGVALTLDRYAFTTFEIDAWAPLAGVTELRERPWVAGLGAELVRERERVVVDEKSPQQPQIVCYSSGELTPFTLTLALGEVPARYRVSGEPNGAIAVARVDAPR